MSSPLFELPWYLSETVYRWETGTKVADLNAASDSGDQSAARMQRFLVEDDPWRDVRVRPYDPMLDQPALFRTFAAVEPTEVSILHFVAEFGTLGTGELAVSHAGAELLPGEALTTWVAEITDMRRAVQLWDWLRERNLAELQKHFRWKRDEPGQCQLFYDSHPDFPPDETPEWPDHRSEGMIFPWEVFAGRPSIIPEGNVVLATRAYLHQFVNFKLWSKVSPRILFDARSMETVLRFKPTNLLSCLWLQFAETMAGGKRQEQCPVCKRYFEVAGSKWKRRDRRYCSAACRNRAYRERLAEAAKQSKPKSKKKATKRKG
jgi:hypothetical protein